MTVTDLPREMTPQLPSKEAEVIPEITGQEIEGRIFPNNVLSQNNDIKDPPRFLEQRLSESELALEGECTTVPMDESAVTSDQVHDDEAEQFLDAQEYERHTEKLWREKISKCTRETSLGTI
ncbi:uncharacterized protein LOC113227989 [Hyposmocoma kahamanoa]|uniref:uncharacterized protein LOC113227989 n=1 Tax=Hyposmocoma kahamanoa TaxID=1477025 RepID=UPI000E6D7055|nr:uncharacterized protein LOC113227989 [Hyposmocoma kahamanoa]